MSETQAIVGMTLKQKALKQMKKALKEIGVNLEDLRGKKDFREHGGIELARVFAMYKWMGAAWIAETTGTRKDYVEKLLSHYFDNLPPPPGKKPRKPKKKKVKKTPFWGEGHCEGWKKRQQALKHEKMPGFMSFNGIRVF